MPSPHTVTCPHCGAETVVLPGTATRRWVCGECGGLIDLRTPEEIAAASTNHPSPDSATEKAHASKWLEGLTPEQQEAIRAELAADPDIVRRELQRVRRETVERSIGRGSPTALSRVVAAAVMLAGCFLAMRPIAAAFLREMGEELDLPELAATQAAGGAALSIGLGVGLVVCALALAVGRRWGAHGAALLLVAACFDLAFHPAMVTYAFAVLLGLFLARRGLE